MYLGQIVEMGTKEEIFSNPLHPYTEALMSAAPSTDPEARQNKKRIILQGISLAGQPRRRAVASTLGAPMPPRCAKP